MTCSPRANRRGSRKRPIWPLPPNTTTVMPTSPPRRQTCLQLLQPYVTRRQLAGVIERLRSTGAVTASQLLFGLIHPCTSETLTQLILARIAGRQIGKIAEKTLRLHQVAVGHRLVELPRHQIRQFLQTTSRRLVVAIDRKRAAIQIVGTVARRQHDLPALGGDI